jgi:TetR/AcrR family tetracycline transcriptional repressor
VDEQKAFESWARAGRGRFREKGLRRLQRRLEPAEVVRAALEVLDETGLDCLTIRAIAARVGVAGPALYWHFRNKQAMLDQMAEAMLAARAAELRSPTDGEAWFDWLAGAAGWLRRALLSHRDGARVFAGTTLPSEPTFLRMLDLVVGVLHAEGFKRDDALRAAMTIYVYVLGFTIEEQAMPAQVSSEPPGAELPGEDGYPHLSAAFRDFERNADRGFDHGLGLILSGLRHAGNQPPPGRATEP